MNQFSNKSYFTMPNEIFSLGLDASEIAVYAYLRCLENRSTYQCWPSYTTIGNAVGRAKNSGLCIAVGTDTASSRASFFVLGCRHNSWWLSIHAIASPPFSVKSPAIKRLSCGFRSSAPRSP